MAPGGRQVSHIVARLLWAIVTQPLAVGGLCMAWAMPLDTHANTTYRVGHRVLVVGDDASRVSALLGKPQSVSRGVHVGGRLPGQNPKRRHRGSRDRKGPRQYKATQWHYRLDTGYVVVTFVSGKVVDISAGR